MKKVIIACAAVLALGLTSCGDTNFCYEVKSTYSIGGIEFSTTSFVWTTKNEIKAYEQQAKNTAKQLGASEDAIKISSAITTFSQEECNKQGN